MSSEKSIAEVEKPANKPTPLIYCGPTLPKGLLLQYTTYRGGLSKHLEPHIKNCPAIRRLFVAPTNLNSAIRAIQIAGTPESVWYKQISEYTKGGVK